MVDETDEEDSDDLLFFPSLRSQSQRSSRRSRRNQGSDQEISIRINAIPSKRIPFRWKSRNIKPPYWWNIARIVLSAFLGVVLLLMSAIPYVVLLPINPVLGMAAGTLTATLLLSSLIFGLQPEVRSFIAGLFLSKKDLDLLPAISPLAHYFWKPKNGAVKADGSTLFFEGTDEIYAVKVYEVLSIPQRMMGKFTNVVKRLYGMQVPFTYYFALTPVKEENVADMILDGGAFSREDREAISSRIQHEVAGVWKAKVFFTTMGIRSKFEGTFNDVRTKLWQDVTRYGNVLKATLQTEYNHMDVQALGKSRILDYMDSIHSGGGEPHFFVTGLESSACFLQLPAMVRRSLPHNVNAEFIVPTFLEYDIGPIGRAFNPMWPQEETPVGLFEEHLPSCIMITGDVDAQRIKTSLNLVHHLLQEGKLCVIITKGQHFRQLARQHPDLIIARVGKDLAFKFFDTEGIDHEYYSSYLTILFETIFHISSVTSSLLRNELNDLYRNEPGVPDLNQFYNQIDLKIKNSTLPYRVLQEYQQIQRIIKSWMTGYLAFCLQETKIPMVSLLQNAPLVLEIDERYHKDHEMVALFLLFKVLLGAEAQDLQDLVVFNDVGKIFKGDYRNPCTVDSIIITLLQNSNQCLIQDIPHANVVQPPYVLTHFHTIVASSVRDGLDLRVLLPLLGIDPRNPKQQPRVTFCRTVDPPTILLKRPDTLEAFPVNLFPIPRYSPFTDEEVWNRFTRTFHDASPVEAIQKATFLEEVFYANPVPPENPADFTPYQILRDLKESMQTRKGGIHTRTEISYPLIETVLQEAIKTRLVERVESGQYTYFTLTDPGREAVEKFSAYYHIADR